MNCGIHSSFFLCASKIPEVPSVLVIIGSVYLRGYLLLILFPISLCVCACHGMFW